MESTTKDLERENKQLKHELVLSDNNVKADNLLHSIVWLVVAEMCILTLSTLASVGANAIMISDPSPYAASFVMICVNVSFWGIQVYVAINFIMGTAFTLKKELHEFAAWLNLIEIRERSTDTL